MVDGSRPMANLGTLTRFPFLTTVRTKLVFSTGLILTIACLLLACLFVRQQVRSAAESSVQSGTLLAQHLAQMHQNSIYTRDLPRLNRHIQEILAINTVAYVAVISPNGELLAGFGKGAWGEQFHDEPTGRRWFAATKLIPPRHRTDMLSDPLVSAIDLTDTGPVLRQKIDLLPGELLALVTGAELPIFYDITIHVPRYPVGSTRDSALRLTLEERLDGPAQDTGHMLMPPTLVQIGLSTTHLQHSLRRLFWQAIILTLSTLGGGLCMAIWLARRITTPLQGLTVAATKLGAGETVPILDIGTRDEIGTLTGVFNNMARRLQSREHELREFAHTLEERVEARTNELAEANAKLQELDHRKSVFVSTASHELRTPLTSMKVHVANLLDGIDGPVTEDQRRSLGRMETNLSRLQILIDDLLDLSQIEMGQTTLRIEPVIVGGMIARVAEDLYALASERRVKILISLPPDIPPLPADPAKLYRIILNLLHNAVKFTKPETAVEIAALQLPQGNIQISVSDVGPGIALEDVEKVFQPFYRASATHRKTKGAGLGLTIAKLLVELHHGRLWVETVPGHGSRFSFALPNSTTVRAGSADDHVVAHHQPQTI